MKKYICLSLVFLFIPVANAMGMSGSIYKIDWDVLGSGGDFGASSSYQLTDTIGETIIGSGSGTTYKTADGFWQGITTMITINMDSSSVNLGNLTPGAPITGQSVATVTTDAWGGYDLYIRKNSLMLHTDTVTTIPDYACNINLPCEWSGVGLGFSVIAGTNIDVKWGSNPNYKYAFIPNSDTFFHRRSGFQSSGDATTIQYKLDVPNTQKSGVYSNNVTYTAMARL